MSTKRQELLVLRNENKVILKDPIPWTDREIENMIYEIKGQRLEETASALQTIAPGSLVSLSTDQLASVPMSDFLKKIRTHDLYKIIQNQHLQKPLTFDDFVREEKLAEEQEESFIFDLIKQRRPLKPTRKPRTVSTSLC